LEHPRELIFSRGHLPNSSYCSRGGTPALSVFSPSLEVSTPSNALKISWIRRYRRGWVARSSSVSVTRLWSRKRPC